MSRFFTASDSSSEESSEEELYSEEEESQEEDSEKDSDEESDDDDDSSSSGSETGANRFLRDASDSEESEDEDRVKALKSAKDKRFDELNNTISAMNNVLKINDWNSVSTGEYSAMSRVAVALGGKSFSNNTQSMTSCSA